MGKSKKAPGYATTSYDTGGLFGKSTTSSKGTTYNPTDYITNAGNTAWGGLNTTLSSLGSNDYSNDPNFQAYQNNLNKQMAQNYDTSVLSNLANRGLMRSSGLQAATNAFADTLADNTMNLYDSYYNRLTNNLSNYRNTLNNLYNYITGVNAGSQQNSQNVSNYNMQAYQAQQQANSNLFGQLANAAGTIAGAAAGGPIGAAIGSKLAGTAAGAA